MSVGFRTGLASRRNPGAAALSMRAIARGLRIGHPIGLADLVEYLEPITLRFPLKNGTRTGHCEVILSNDGRVRFQGRVHESGAATASYSVIVSFPSLSTATNDSPRVTELVGTLGILVLAHRGHVGGTLSFDTHDSTWDKATTHARLAYHWPAVRIAAQSARMDFGTHTGALEIADGVLNGATGFWVFSL